MNEVYFFWNAMNLVCILCGILAIGLLAGSVLHTLVTIVTQVDDPAVSLLTKLSGCVLTCYLASGFIFSSLTKFYERILGGADTFK